MKLDSLLIVSLPSVAVEYHCARRLNLVLIAMDGTRDRHAMAHLNILSEGAEEVCKV